MNVVRRTYSTARFPSPVPGAHRALWTGTSAYFFRVTSIATVFLSSPSSRVRSTRTLEFSGPRSASATSYRLSPATGTPSTATMTSLGRTPATSAGPPGVGATTTMGASRAAEALLTTSRATRETAEVASASSPYAISTPTPVTLALIVDSESCAYFSGSRKRVNGSSSFASIARIAAYVSSVESIGVFFTVSSRYLNQLTPLNVLSTYALSTARHASRNRRLFAVIALAGAGHGASDTARDAARAARGGANRSRRSGGAARGRGGGGGFRGTARSASRAGETRSSAPRPSAETRKRRAEARRDERRADAARSDGSAGARDATPAVVDIEIGAGERRVGPAATERRGRGAARPRRRGLFVIDIR